ncbi:OBERON-like protein isoform X3 [Physcomitrium patens]|uniref:OBERON-like protein n=1 Tax=Physcomitrium patens TaxID=3218 RepID=A0A7I4A8P1_PHYPA
MKRSRSHSEGGGGQELNVGVNLHNVNAPFQPRASVASMSHPQISLSLVSSEGRTGTGTEPCWAGNTQLRDSPTESASSRETWPTQVGSQQDTIGGQGQNEEVEEGDEEEAEQKVVQRADVRDILGNQNRREEFSLLQRLLTIRRDFTPERLMRAHKTQLEIFVALKTGILAFLLPDISVFHTALVEIFFHKTCRNISCRSPLPANDCTCECCRSMSGFCNQCMCVMCSKFDFDANTFRWLGCDVCSHWTHSDCAMRSGTISMGVSTKAGSDRDSNSCELIFRCRACGGVSELLGWARDVFQNCALRWERDSLGKELDYVRRIFHMADDTKGNHLGRKAQEVLDKMKNGLDTSSAIKEILCFFQADTENVESKDKERDNVKVLDRREVCDRVAGVVREVIAKLEGVAEEKVLLVKKARSALESSDRELKDKQQELADLLYEKQRKKQQIEELESIVRLKRAEAEMFQFKSDEARREAEGLQRIVSAKVEKVEEEYTSRYLKLRLEEAEAERRLLFDKLQGPDAVRFLKGSDPSQMLLLNKIHGLFERVGMVSTMPPEGPSTPTGNAANAGSILAFPSTSVVESSCSGLASGQRKRRCMHRSCSIWSLKIFRSSEKEQSRLDQAFHPDSWRVPHSELFFV